MGCSGAHTQRGPQAEGQAAAAVRSSLGAGEAKAVVGQSGSGSHRSLGPEEGQEWWVLCPGHLLLLQTAWGPRRPAWALRPSPEPGQLSWGPRRRGRARVKTHASWPSVSQPVFASSVNGGESQGVKSPTESEQFCGSSTFSSSSSGFPTRRPFLPISPNPPSISGTVYANSLYDYF